MNLIDAYPDFYKNLWPKKLSQAKVIETKATCDQCLRSRDHRFEYTYDSQLKCCTFFPFLPNFLVGGILSENLPGAEVIYKKIKNKSFALPLGVLADFKYQYRFNSKSKTDFGNRKDLLCPYYDKNQNQCGIWKYRGVVCSTYFCRSNYGLKGKKFWKELSDYLSYLELSLAEDFLVLKGFSPRDISDQLMYMNKDQWSETEKNQVKILITENKKIWNGFDNPVDFYIESYNQSKNLDRNYFLEISGELGLNLEKNVLYSLAALS